MKANDCQNVIYNNITVQNLAHSVIARDFHEMAIRLHSLIMKHVHVSLLSARFRWQNLFHDGS